MSLDRPETVGPDEEGCAFLDEANARCGVPRKRGSAYCEPHHALCYGGGLVRYRVPLNPFIWKFVRTPSATRPRKRKGNE